MRATRLCLVPLTGPALTDRGSGGGFGPLGGHLGDLGLQVGDPLSLAAHGPLGGQDLAAQASTPLTVFMQPSAAWAICPNASGSKLLGFFASNVQARCMSPM